MNFIYLADQGDAASALLGVRLRRFAPPPPCPFMGGSVCGRGQDQVGLEDLDLLQLSQFTPDQGAQLVRSADRSGLSSWFCDPNSASEVDLHQN